MKRQLRYFLTLLLVMVASVGWADETTTTYLFQGKTWTAIFDGTTTKANWTSGKDAAGYTAGQGIQVTTKVTGANATSPVSFSNVTKIVVTYNTNKSAGKGAIKVQIGENNEMSQDVAYPSGSSDDGRFANYTASFSDIDKQSGFIKLTVECTTNSIYIKSIAITCDEGSSSSVATHVTINSTGITNTDVYTSTAAGQLTATVKDADDATIDGATVTWTSGNESVATIATDGTVTLVAEGSTTITAAYAGVEDVYKSSSATYELTVTNSDPNKPGSQNNPYTVAQALANTPASGTSANVYVRGIVSKLWGTTIMDDGTNYRYYISDDGTTTDQMLVYRGKGLDNVAFANADDLLVGDEVVILGGLTTYNNTKEIAANNYIVSLNRNSTKVATPTFTPAAGTYREAQSVTISTITDDATIYYTTDGTDPTTASNVYSEAISVSETMTIKAFAAKEGMDDSEIATAAYTIISVNPKNVGSNYFVKVTDVADLEDGDAILIVNEENNKAMGTNQNTANRSSALVTITGSTIEPGTSVQKFVLTDAGNDQWMFCVGTSAADGFLYASSSSANQLKTTTLPDENANATITITDGNAAIQFQGSNTRNTLRFNSTNSPQIFSCYAASNTQKDVQIYKEVEKPTVSVTIGETEYATLYYSSLNLTVPAGVTATAYKADGTALTAVKTYSEGDVIPAATGVVLNGTAGDYTFAISADEGAVATGNMLRGSDEEATTTGGGKYYMLSLAATGGNETVGFYYGAENGAAFTNGAHKAYLAVPEGTEAKAAGYAFNDATGIRGIIREQLDADGTWYTIDGKRLNGEPAKKGIYVVNGKKVVLK